MAIYTTLISLNLAAIVLPRVRAISALLSGFFHLSIGTVHVVRLAHPFRFEIFNLPWPLAASAREVAIVVGFGVLCLAVAWWTWRRNGEENS